MRSLLFVYLAVPLLLLGDTVPGTPETQLAEAERLAWVKNWTRAEPFFAAAEQGFQARGDKRNALFAQVGRLRGQLPKLPLAETSDTLATLLDDPLVQNDPELKLRCLAVKGDVDMDFDVELAYRDWTEALEVAQQLGHKAWTNRANAELGLIAFLQGDSRTSVLKLFAALKTAESLGDVGAQIRYSTIIAKGLTEFGRADQAIPMLDKAIALTESTPDLNVSLMAYAGKAQALLTLQKKAEAGELINKALAIARQNGSAGFEADLRIQLGLLASKSGDSQTAMDQFRTAADLAASVNGYRLMAVANLHLSQLALKAGNLAVAERSSLAGVEASRETGDRYFLPKHLAQLAELNVARKRYRDADEQYEAAGDIMRGMLVNAASSGAKASLIGVMEQVYTGHFETEAVHLGRLDRAFEVIEQSRGRALTDVLRTRPVTEQRISARLSSTERRISRLQIELGKSRTKVQRRALLNQLDQVEQELSPLQAAYEKAWLQHETQPVALTRLRRALNADEAVLHYVLAEPNSYCMSIRREGVTLHKLPSKNRITKLVEAFAEDLKQNGTATAPASELFNAVLGNVQLGGKKRLIIVPDGPLNRIPFDPLIDHAGRIVLESFIVSYAPSATAFHILKARRPSLRKLPLLAIASSPATSTETPNQAATAKRSVPQGVFDTQTSELSPLPAARREVEQVAQAMGSASVTLVGDKAQESAVKALPLDSYRVLHFAAHGLVSTRFPDRSALILNGDRTEDGLLQAREIGRLRLDADLVTLSACDAGAGRIVGQEGVSNLARPFLVSGAKTVVANLWQVNDEFSRSLMQAFYTRLSAGKDKALALHEAKRELIQRYGNDATPSMWAGFILIGDTRGTASGPPQ